MNREVWFMTLGDLLFQYELQDPETASFFRGQLNKHAEGLPADTICVTPEYMAENRWLADGAETSAAFLEFQSLMLATGNALLSHKSALFHGAAMLWNGLAWIFTAPSGTGKSTHTALWRRLLIPRGHEVVMVNDDKPLIRVAPEGIFACGTPWNGAHRLSENISLPVKAICVIGRGEVNSIGVIPFGQAFAAMYRQNYRPPNAEGLSLMLDMLNEVCRRVTFYSLKCNISEEAAEIAYNTMK